jgi:hypothetical protein
MPQMLKVIPAKADFADTNSKVSTAIKSEGFNTVRRPTRGITIRDDTFATMRVVTGDGSNLKLIDAGGLKSDMTVTVNGKTLQATDIYSNFLIQNVVEDRQEKVQVLETFGEPYVFFFGERPRTLGIQGILLNSWDFNWEAEWWANYDALLRGTRCVENDARVYLAFDNTIVGGYILSSNVQKNAQERNWLQFQFNLFVTYYETFSNLGDNKAYPPETKFGIDFTKLTGSEIEGLIKVGRPSYPISTAPYVAVVNPLTGVVEPAKQASALSSQLQVSNLASAWQNVQRVTRRVLSTASQVWAGEVVRVPEGFEGAFAYDEEITLAKEVRKKGDTALKYSYGTFAMNKDEYVGTSSHYGSTFPKNSKLLDVSPDDTYASGETSAKKVKDLLIAKGIDPNDALSNTLFKIGRVIKVVRAGIGVLNLARGVVGIAKEGVNSAAPNMTGGWPWNQKYSQLSKSSNDNPYPE